MRLLGGLALAALLLQPPDAAAKEDRPEPQSLVWSELPSLPPPAGLSESIGVAGPFSGVHAGALIVAGGANFPDAPPWRGGEKVWYDDVFVLERTDAGELRWIAGRNFKLPRPLAYGVSVSIDGGDPAGSGVLCIGGCDANQCSSDVFLLKWDAASRTIAIESMPSLPRPLAFMAGALADRTVYVAGGQESMTGAATKNFFSLDLSQRGSVRFAWRELPAWPGPARILPVCAAQSDGTGEKIYVFSGRHPKGDGETELLHDARVFDPEDGSWRTLADVAPNGAAPQCIMAGSAAASGVHHILVLGGDEGGDFMTLERMRAEIAAETDAVRADELTRLLAERLDGHPGFSRDVLGYHTVTDRWTKFGELPAPAPVTAAAVRWDGAIVLVSGEVRPGVRSPALRAGRAPPVRAFGSLNYAVLGVYLLVLVGMGVYFSRREKSTDDFFKAGGRVPWWAAGLSIFGTQLSAITFMALPAKTFAADWRYLTMNLTILLVAPFIILFFLPFYRGLDVTTAYEYLERRFNLAARLIGSAMFIAFQLGRMSIMLFLPSIALSVVTGIDVAACILVMGTLSITYTVLGGIEAVIWTDVLQVVVLFAGSLISLVVICFSVPGGLLGLVETGRAAGKFHTFDFAFDLSGPVFWVVLLGGIAANLISYGSDQAVIQRYLTTRDERSAARGIWTNGLLCIPASLLFFGMGTALFAFYRSHPRAMNPTLENGDAVFPWFIVTELPPGVAGLVIAAVFAASMSSLDSSMNSVAAAVTTDFYRRFRSAVDEHVCLRLARWVTVIVGALGTGFALMMAGWGIRSLLDQYLMVIGFFAGGLGGLFLLGIFSRRAHGAGAVLGLVASAAVQYAVKELTPVSFLLYTFTGMASCLAAGYAGSILIPARAKPVEGLTLFTRNKLDERRAS